MHAKLICAVGQPSGANVSVRFEGRFVRESATAWLVEIVYVGNTWEKWPPVDLPRRMTV